MGKEGIYHLQFSDVEKPGSENLGNMPKITQLRNGTGHLVQAVNLQTSHFFSFLYCKAVDSTAENLTASPLLLLSHPVTTDEFLNLS